MREEPVTFPPGFQPFALVQCQPPAVVTALTLHSEWKLVTFGTSHGFGLYDYQQKSNVLVRYECVSATFCLYDFNITAGGRDGI